MEYFVNKHHRPILEMEYLAKKKKKSKSSKYLYPEYDFIYIKSANKGQNNSIVPKAVCRSGKVTKSEVFITIEVRIDQRKVQR